MWYKATFRGISQNVSPCFSKKPSTVVVQGRRYSSDFTGVIAKSGVRTPWNAAIDHHILLLRCTNPGTGLIKALAQFKLLNSTARVDSRSPASCPFNWLTAALSRAAHRHIYSFFTAIRAPSFTHIYTNTPHSTSTACPGRDRP